MSRVTHLLIHTLSIYRQNEIPKGRGRWQENLESIALNIRGRVFFPSGSERMTGEQTKTYNTGVGYLEPTQEVARDDYLVKDGVWYRVTAVLPPSIPHHRKVSLELIERAELLS